MHSFLRSRTSRVALIATTSLALSGPSFADGHGGEIVHDWSGFYFGTHVGALVGRTTALENEGTNDYGEYSKAEPAFLGASKLASTCRPATLFTVLSWTRL